MLFYLYELQISSNGLISFGDSYLEYIRRLFPINEKVIAPYWDDIDLTGRGSIHYDSFNTLNGSEVLRNVSAFINSVYRTPNMFEASSAVVVYWRDTCPIDDWLCSNVSFFL